MDWVWVCGSSLSSNGSGEPLGRMLGGLIGRQGGYRTCWCLGSVRSGDMDVYEG